MQTATNGSAAFLSLNPPAQDLPDDVLEKLRSEHGEIAVCRAAGEVVAVRVAKMGEYKHVRSMMNNPKTRPDGLEQLFRYTCVYPLEASEVDAMLRRRPGLAETFGATAAELCGLVEADVKKY